jgi:hypothetical protein
MLTITAPMRFVVCVRACSINMVITCVSHCTTLKTTVCSTVFLSREQQRNLQKHCLKKTKKEKRPSKLEDSFVKNSYIIQRVSKPVNKKTKICYL